MRIMIMLSQFFQLLPLPANQVTGTYSIRLVILSYLVATAASYVALDITSRMRDVGVTRKSSFLWLIGGSFAMGAGIWSMHFIGMLAFIMPMPMPMAYAPGLTFLSMMIAIIASGIAFSLLRSLTIKPLYLILGGVMMGFSIAAMHYVGMAAMSISMTIRYLPSLFLLSIVIAIIASEAALYLAIKSNQGTLRRRTHLKIVSAFIMGAAICGMHYTGMAAAVFTPLTGAMDHVEKVNPDMLASFVAIATMLIIGVAMGVSSFKALLIAKTVTAARQAGMAEVASNVLHNVGNVLNSVNVSATLMKEHLEKIDMTALQQVNQLMIDHKKDLGAFITTDPQGAHLPDYLQLLNEHWQIELQFLKEELKRLTHNIQHINDVISMQQTLSGISSFEELVDVSQLIDEALAVVSIDFVRHHIKIKKEYAKLMPVYLDKLKLTQILINLIRNAKESLSAVDTEHKSIWLRTKLIDNDKFCVQISDNGLGIPLSDKSKIFSHGFTTKAKGHGFGLHTSAISAKEMNGELQVTSEGSGQGATFSILLPYQSQSKEALPASRPNGADNV